MVQMIQEEDDAEMVLSVVDDTKDYAAPEGSDTAISGTPLNDYCT